jgi:hypothetical protein
LRAAQLVAFDLCDALVEVAAKRTNNFNKIAAVLSPKVVRRSLTFRGVRERRCATTLLVVR